MKYIDILHKSAINTNFNIHTVSRYKDLSLFEVHNKPSFSRQLISYISRFITNILFLNKVSDTQCGCKIFDKDLLGIAFNEPFISGWLFDIEIFLRLKKANKLNLLEHQIVRLNDNSGSRLERKHLMQIAKELVCIVLKYL